ncbi:hypothetical protein DH2020_048368 [Rehmannia glutinosa]|uniref:NAC domain-containing protein n=1 Tax=Rehmannia glutinosa TaxID=99300 RepID=A0ABR0U5U5_REHGL
MAMIECHIEPWSGPISGPNSVQKLKKNTAYDFFRSEIKSATMNTFSHVPPGFRFHPTDEELVDYYLRRKVTSRSIDLDVIKDVDLYKIEPWDLQEGWVVCRVFKKRIASTQKFSEHDSPIWYDDHVSFMPEMESPKQQHSYNPNNNNLSYNYPYNNNNNNTSCKKGMTNMPYGIIPSSDHHHFLNHHHLPLLESPKMLHPQSGLINTGPTFPFGGGVNVNRNPGNNLQTLDQSIFRNNENSTDQVTDWRLLDKFVASQLSQEEEVSKENDTFPASDDSNLISRDMNKQENASTSSSSCQIDLWK